LQYELDDRCKVASTCTRKAPNRDVHDTVAERLRKRLNSRIKNDTGSRSCPGAAQKQPRDIHT
jgi:hypothetical protein